MLIRETFWFTRRAQHGSPLISRMPLEIRLMILRQLMTRAEPVPVLQSSTKTDDPPQKIEFQILRVCQILYSEGIGLMCRENVLRLSVTLVGRALGKVNLFCLRTHRNINLANIYLPHWMYYTEELVELYTRIRLDFGYEKGNRFYVDSALTGLEVAIQKLQNMFNKKNLQIAFPEKMVDRCRRGNISSKRWLGSFRSLRCQKIQFVDFEQHEWAQIAQVVQSRKEVMNLPAEAERVLAYLGRCGRLANGRNRNNRNDTTIVALTESARLFEVNKFNEAKTAILEKADRYIEMAKEEFLAVDEGAAANSLTSNG